MVKKEVIEGELEKKPESELVVAEETGIVSLTSAMSSKDLKQAVKLMTEQRQIIADFIKENLVKDVDYGTIESTSASGKTFKSKPTLYKPGMEKILSLFGLASELEKDSETLEMTNIVNAIAFKCSITRNGQKIAEGRGAAVVGDMKRDLNSTIKIAEKRARMDACLSLGFSEYFTQDMDDPEYKNKTNQNTSYDSMPGPMSDPQRKMIFVLLKKAGIEDNELQKATFNLNCPHREGEAISKKEASEFIDKLQKGTFERPAPDEITDDDIDLSDVDIREESVLATDEIKGSISIKLDSLGLKEAYKLRFLKEVTGKITLKGLSDAEWMDLEKKIDAVLSGTEELPVKYLADVDDKQTPSKKQLNVSEGDKDGSSDSEDE